VVGWACGLIEHLRDNGHTTCEPTNEAHEKWETSVREAYESTLIPTAKSWFTGYNSNLEGHDKLRYLIYLRGAVNFRSELVDVSSNGYRGFQIS
jgi:hypothetical protein